MAEPILEAKGLFKSFGAIVATDAFSLAVVPGTVHALIGPNGAGKTTVIAQLAGELRPDAGAIRFLGQDVTRLPVHERVRAGLARSYQVTSLFPSFSAVENVILAVEARRGVSRRFWPSRSRDRAMREEAQSYLDRVGLGPLSDRPAGHLAHGEQRQLEIAMALATQPAMLLLDEPMAGMGQEETQRMTEVLRPLTGEITLLLVEHDMDVVFALADAVTVMVQGRAIVTGPPDAVRADPAVRAAYLGADA